AQHAKRVAKHLHTDHTELYLSPRDALSVVPLLPSIHDEPFADSSQIPTYLISKLARGSVTVSLSGDGGDELFGGYNRYLLTKSIWVAISRTPAFVRNVAAQFIRKVPSKTIDRAFAFVSPVVPARVRFPTPGDKAHKLAD